MSHYSTVTVKIDDVNAVKDACKELGLIIKEKGTIRYYYNQGHTTADYVISIPNCPYDVGLVKDPLTGNYNLVYDKYGGHVEKVLGVNCCKLVQSATYHKIAKHAKLKGFFITKQDNKGKLQVILQKN